MRASVVWGTVLLGLCLAGPEGRGGDKAAEALKFHKEAIAAFNKKDYDQAIAGFTAALKLNPTFAQAHQFRGLSYYLKRDLDRAITDLTKRFA